MNKFAPLHPKVNTLLHGADYNPEQWENDPDIIDKDIAMMQQAKCNVISPGWILSSINCMPPAFMYFWPRRAARVRRGCLNAIRRFCGWGAIGCRPCTAAVTTTVCHRRSIVRRP